MDEKNLAALTKKVAESSSASDFLPALIDLTLEFGRAVPEHIAPGLDASGKDWRYYNTMIDYAIKWYRLGFSPSKLKKLMNEAIGEMGGPENDKGKSKAMRMFIEYLQLKKTIDAHLAEKNGNHAAF